MFFFYFLLIKQSWKKLLVFGLHTYEAVENTQVMLTYRVSSNLYSSLV